MLPPPGMFWGTTVGLPGRCLPMWRATTRPQRSYPPPDPEPMIICTLLPARLGACAAADAVRAAIEATATVILLVAIMRSASVKFPARKVGDLSLGSYF